MKLLRWFNRKCNIKKCTCWFDGSWGDCCCEHDKDIIEARTKTAHEADWKLFKCVWNKNKIMAVIMFIGVKPISFIAWHLYRKKII